MTLFDKLPVVMLALRVLVLSDDPLGRDALCSILDEEETINVVGQDALAKLREELLDVYRPDVLLVEDEESDPVLRRKLIALGIPYICLVDERTIISITTPDPNTLQRDIGLPVLCAALHAVTAGLSVYSRPEGFTPHLYHQMDYPIEKLTARESEVLQLIGQGLTNRAIGQALSIKESTVKYHVNSILRKLDAQSRTEAISIATRIGWITY